MAPRKMKDRRGSTDVKEEPLSEAASSALGDDANQKKKRGRPRKAASAGEAGTYTEGNPGGIEEEEEGEEEGEASNEEGTYEEDQKGPSAAMGAALPNEQKKEVIVMKKKTRRVTHHRHHIMNGSDGLDLHQCDLLIKCLGRKTTHRRKSSKPTRAAQASF